MLDKRLRCAADMVRPGSRVADIGTDHAHLPVWLVEQGICPRAIASDIRVGPAQAARRTVAAAGLEALVDVRVGDGLSPLRPGEADDIVIAGMGGETIAAILEAAPWARDGRIHWILQPMTRPECLRRFLLTHGFAIGGERVVEDGRRLYLVLEAVYTGAPPVTEEAAYYIGSLSPEQGAAYLRGQAAHLRRRADGLAGREPDHPDIPRLRELARAIDRYIEGGEGPCV